MMEPENGGLRKTLRAVTVGLVLLGLIPMYEAYADIGVASWYSTEACQYNPDPKCPMANGESLYEAIQKEEETGEHFAAMWGVPLGSRIKVTNRLDSRSTYVVIKDRGPNKRLKRIIDLSKSAFEAIASSTQGLIKVEVSYG